MIEEMIIDIARGLRATMPIIDPDKDALQAGLRCAQRPGLHLAVVLQQVIGLDHGHGELAVDDLPAVLVPQEPVLPPRGVRSSAGAPGWRRRPPARSQILHGRGGLRAEADRAIGREIKKNPLPILISSRIGMKSSRSRAGIGPSPLRPAQCQLQKEGGGFSRGGEGDLGSHLEQAALAAPDPS
jgi:hypothetical protein